MARLNYETEHFQKVIVKGIECDFNDMRIDRATVPEGKYLYEIGSDDDCGDTPARVKVGVMVNFYGTLISDVPLPLGQDGVLWLEENDFAWA